MIYARVTSRLETIKELMHQSVLKAHRNGILGSHRDGGQSPVVQHEWHIDHAPTLQEVLSRKTR